MQNENFKLISDRKKGPSGALAWIREVKFLRSEGKRRAHRGEQKKGWRAKNQAKAAAISIESMRAVLSAFEDGSGSTSKSVLSNG